MGEHTDLMQRFYDELLSNGNLDAIDDLVTDDVVDHEQMPGQPDGKEGVRWFAEMMSAGFSDFKATMGPSLESGDLAAAEFKITARHTGEFMGVPATDKQVEVESIDMIRVQDGKCAEHWGQFDAMSLMQQLGAIPEPAQT
jgi:steroid delta-isomerase-like uncharacterized protein